MQNRFLKKAFGAFPGAKKYLAYGRYARETGALILRHSHHDAAGAVFFTSQKCASTFITRAFRILSHEYPAKSFFNFEELYWHTHEGNIYEAMRRDAQQLFMHRHAIYGPLREYVEMPNMDRRPIVLMLRDPRDVLVSDYFSIAYSHALPGAHQARIELLERRQRFRQTTLDRGVFYALSEFLPKYQRYADTLLGRDNVRFITYEQLVADFSGWAVDFLGGLGLPPDAGVIAKLEKEFLSGGPKADREDVTHHRRQGAPGEFRRKLQPETIDELNAVFAPLLDTYGCWR